jgi:hypothetical protein
MNYINGSRPTATDTRITTGPFALIVHGHCWLAGLHDEGAPIWVHPDDARPAWQIEHLDATCPGRCDSRQAIQNDERGCIVTTGHADGCGWFAAWLDAAGLGASIGIVAAALSGCGAS